MPWTACLLAKYDATSQSSPGYRAGLPPIFPYTDEMLMIRPQPRSIMLGANSWQRRQGASTLISKHARHSASDTVGHGPLGPAPALLHRMSICPAAAPI